MKKLPMLVAAAFAFVSCGALALPKAAETAAGTVVTASASVPLPQAAAKSAKKPVKKPAAKKTARKRK